MIEIHNFKNALKEIVRPNRFMVTINPPSIYDHGTDLQNLKFFTQSTKIPERTTGDVIIKWHGMEYHIPGDTTHDDLILTILNEAEWAARNFFENWSMLLQNTNSEGFEEGKNARVDAIDMLSDASLIVEQLGNTEDEVLARYKFYDVFPKSVGDIELSMDTIDTAETFQVTFAYSYWEQI